MPWYSGPTLLEVLESVDGDRRAKPAAAFPGAITSAARASIFAAMPRHAVCRRGAGKGQRVKVPSV